MGSVLSLRAIRHRRGGRDVLAIDRLDLAAGERLAVLGPNGAGKTTLLRLMAGLEAPTAGTVEVDGVRTVHADAELRRRIGFATQRAGLLSTSVLRNIELPLRWRGAGRASRREAALAALRRLGVEHLAGRPAPALSGGEAQRVSLARALALGPRLLLLDEPAAGLDAEARRSFLDDLAALLADRSISVVHVSHRPDEALRLADRVAVLVGGAVRQLAEPSHVLREPADATVARLVGYENVLPARIDPAGRVLVAGQPCGLRADRPPGAVTVAAWATAVRLLDPGTGGLEATVDQVAAGPGRWEVVLATEEAPLRAHLPLAEPPPRPGERHAVRVVGSLATLIGGQDGCGCARPRPCRCSH
jgi:ABC-type sulfate/molybdate transport systems ATPase subunit